MESQGTVAKYEIMYSLLYSKFNTCPSLLFFSKDLHPAFSRIAESRAIVPSGTPLRIVQQPRGKCVNFEMSEVVTVKLSPNRSNIMYVERRRTDLETDFSESLSTLKEKQKDTLRVVVYCRTLMICADLFSRFSYEMGKSQYYPPSALQGPVQVQHYSIFTELICCCFLIVFYDFCLHWGLG